MSSLRVTLWEQLAFHQLCCRSFLTLRIIPRTSPPFAGIWRLPINPVLFDSSWSDWLGAKAKRPFFHTPGDAAFHKVSWCPLSQQLFSCRWPLSLYVCLCYGTVKSVNSNCLSMFLLALYTKAVATYSLYRGTRCTYVTASLCRIARLVKETTKERGESGKKNI